jgi:hypothetical protein
MTILNETELNASIATINDAGANTAAEVRQVFTDLKDSLQSYGGVIDDGVSVGNSITTTPTKWTNFSVNQTGPNQMLEADVANNRILVYEPALYFLTLRFQGKWAANEDLRFLVYVNGSPNPISPISFAAEGNGATDPKIVSVTDIAFLINSAMIAGGTGGTQAEVELYFQSDSGTFNLDQDDITMGMESNPLSIRTVG